MIAKNFHNKQKLFKGFKGFLNKQTEVLSFRYESLTFTPGIIGEQNWHYFYKAVYMKPESIFSSSYQ